MIRIIIDSTCDYTPEDRKKFDLQMLPLTIHFGTESFLDSIDLDSKSFYHKLRQSKVLPTTSQVPPGDFEDAFRPHIKKGDEILVITISSLLSATYASAITAAKTVSPGKIHVIDSNSGSFGSALLINRAVKLRDEGKMTAKEIAEDLRALAPRIHLYAVVDSLKYLKMGGRLTGSAALIGTILGIKPLIEVYQGKVKSIDKIRGERNINKTLLDYFHKAKPKFEYGVTFGNSDAKEGMQEVIKLFKPELEGVDIYQSDLGAVIGTHVGPGVIGVAFIA